MRRLFVALALLVLASPAWAQALDCRGNSVLFPEALVNYSAEESLVIDVPNHRITWDDTGTTFPILFIDNTWITWRSSTSYAYYDGALNRITGKRA